MRVLLFVFLLNNYINLQPKAAAKAMNLAFPMLGGIPQYESSNDYLDPQNSQLQIVAAQSGPIRMQGQINRGLLPQQLVPLMPDKMNPMSQNEIINRQLQPNMNEMINRQMKQDINERMNRFRAPSAGVRAIPRYTGGGSSFPGGGPTSSNFRAPDPDPFSCPACTG